MCIESGKGAPEFIGHLETEEKNADRDKTLGEPYLSTRKTSRTGSVRTATETYTYCYYKSMGGKYQVPMSARDDKAHVATKGSGNETGNHTEDNETKCSVTYSRLGLGVTTQSSSLQCSALTLLSHCSDTNQGSTVPVSETNNLSGYN